ncbi:MAG: lamin tail domain-containing protein [Fibrobacterota bacterium]
MIHRIAVLITAGFIQVYALGVVITEVHRDPVGRESDIPGGRSHEFVEIANLGKDTFCLGNLFLTDGMDADSVIPFENPLAGHDDCIFNVGCISPGGVALILDRDYEEALEIDPGSALPISPQTVILTVSDGDLGNGLSADDGVLLYRGTAKRIDSVIDLAADMESSAASPVSAKLVLSSPSGVPEGFSVMADNLLLGERTYDVCSDSMTPGCYEKLLESCLVEESIRIENDSAVCTLAVFLLEENADRAYEFVSLSGNGQKEILREGILTESRGSIQVFRFELRPVQYQFRLELNGSEIVHKLDISKVWVPDGALRITEVFPRSDSDEPEWFELKNASDVEVNLKGWFFGNSEDTASLCERDYILLPGDFVVCCKDEALMKRKYYGLAQSLEPKRWHTLNNYGDTLCLWTPCGQLVDRVCYRSAWFDEWKGQSLERLGDSLPGLEKSSWVLSDPTPVYPGKSGSWRLPGAPSLEVGPVPFTPDGDEKDDFCAIRVEIPAGYSARLRVFGFGGRELVTFEAVQELMLWDGVCADGRRAPPGVFFVVGEFTSAAKRIVIRKKGVLWR